MNEVGFSIEVISWQGDNRIFQFCEKGASSGISVDGFEASVMNEHYLYLVSSSVKMGVFIESPQKLMGSAEPIEPILTRPLDYHI